MAIRHETAGIPDDTKALLFALGSLCGLLPRVIAAHLLHPFALLIGNDPSHAGGFRNVYRAIDRPRLPGIACAVGAVAMGLIYMTIAGAPVRYMAMNTSALGIGLAAAFGLSRIGAADRRWTGASIAAAAVTLLATAALGDKADGAARWVNFAGISVQPSLILLPVMLIAFSRSRDAIVTASIVVAAVAMAFQPDRAMSGALALGLTVLALIRPDRHVMTALIASIAGFAVTLARADNLPAAPFVDQILYTAFDVHAAAGAAVLAGSALLLIPAIIGWRYDPASRASYAVFGAIWFAALIAAAFGNYPTPVVGYGGSAIIGYVLSLWSLPRYAQGRAKASAPITVAEDRSPADHHPIVGVA